MPVWWFSWLREMLNKRACLSPKHNLCAFIQTHWRACLLSCKNVHLVCKSSYCFWQAKKPSKHFCCLLIFPSASICKQPVITHCLRLTAPNTHPEFGMTDFHLQIYAVHIWGFGPHTEEMKASLNPSGTQGNMLKDEYCLLRNLSHSGKLGLISTVKTVGLYACTKVLYTDLCAS